MHLVVIKINLVNAIIKYLILLPCIQYFVFIVMQDNLFVNEGLGAQEMGHQWLSSNMPHCLGRVGKFILNQ